ncbi:MAG: hypothetical protein DMG50_20710 [Acidobacteria bacterium]|nr:MAG: hypothetical protein DMG50_20710 [Acidobacteriota bacterium]
MAVIYDLLNERRVSIVLNDTVHPEFHRMAKVPKRENRLAVELFQPPEEFVSFFLASDGIVLHGSFILNSAVNLVGLPESRIERRAVIGSWPAISSFSSSAAVTSFSAFPQFS